MEEETGGPKEAEKPVEASFWSVIFGIIKDATEPKGEKGQNSFGLPEDWTEGVKREDLPPIMQALYDLNAWQRYNKGELVRYFDLYPGKKEELSLLMQDALKKTLKMGFENVPKSNVQDGHLGPAPVENNASVPQSSKLPQDGSV